MPSASLKWEIFFVLKRSDIRLFINAAQAACTSAGSFQRTCTAQINISLSGVSLLGGWSASPEASDQGSGVRSEAGFGSGSNFSVSNKRSPAEKEESFLPAVPSFSVQVVGTVSCRSARFFLPSFVAGRADSAGLALPASISSKF